MLFLNYFDLIDWHDTNAATVHAAIDNDRLIYLLATAFSLSRLRVCEPDVFKSTIMDVIGYSTLNTIDYDTAIVEIFEYVTNTMRKLIYITNTFNDCNVEESRITIKRSADGVYITYQP